MQKLYGPDIIVAEIKHADRPGVQMKMADVAVTEKLEKFVEDVKYVKTKIHKFTILKKNF